MEEFTKNYNRNELAINGPQLIVKTLLDFCDIDNTHRNFLPGYKIPQEKTLFITKKKNLNQTFFYLDKCANLIIFPQNYFYPLSFLNSEFLKNSFSKNSKNDETYWKAIKILIQFISTINKRLCMSQNQEIEASILNWLPFSVNLHMITWKRIIYTLIRYKIIFSIFLFKQSTI